MSDKFLSYENLDYLLSLIANYYPNKNDINNLIQRKSYDEWLNLGDKVFPSGVLLVYTNRTMSEEGTYVPDLKIADGSHTVDELKFILETNPEKIIAEYVEIEDKNEESLCLLGSVENGNKVLRNTEIKIQGSTIYAERLAGAADRVQNKLHIGENTYDGSSEVFIPVYKGE